MSNFSRKAVNKNEGSSVDAAEWDEWNAYVASCFKAKEVDKGKGKIRKQKTLIGKVNFVFDMGTPPSEDGQFDTKCALPEGDEQYSKEELAHKEKNPTHDFVWVTAWDDNKKSMVQTRKQTSPMQPQQEYGVCVDFPQWLVDYSKHPMIDSDGPMLRPYRISLNGSFRGEVQRTIPFEVHWQTGKVKDNNLIYKICAAAGREKELIESEFDIGTIAGAICNFKVTCDLTNKDDKTFFNVSATKPEPVEDIEVGDIEVSAQAQIDKAMDVEGLQPFVGVLLDMDMEDYTDEMLSMVGHDTHKFVKRAMLSEAWNVSGVSKAGKEYSIDKGINYEDTNFSKAYAAWLKKQEEKKNSEGSTEDNTETKAASKTEQKKTTPDPEPAINDGIDFDDK